jgi:Universal stress protein family
MSVIGRVAAAHKSPAARGRRAVAPAPAGCIPAQRLPRERPPRRVVVAVDGSAGSAAAFRQAAAQARQRNALLDVVCILPPSADTTAATMAKVMLGQFTRRQCPYGVGTPMRLRVERGDPQTVLLVAGAGAELLIGPDEAACQERGLPAAVSAAAEGTGRCRAPRRTGRRVRSGGGASRGS